MKIPNFINEQFVDKNGHLTKPWQHTLEQLFNQLQTQMSDEGHIMPSQSTANIAKLADPNTAGALIYDSDTKTAKINLDGVIKEIQTV